MQLLLSACPKTVIGHKLAHIQVAKDFETAVYSNT